MKRTLARSLFFTALIAGCAAPPTSMPDAVTQTHAVIDPEECIEIVVSSSAAPPEELRTVATEVVLGRFGGYGPAQWNTPGGRRPSKLEAQQKPARLQRSLDIDPIERIVGAGAALDRAVVAGGVSGCDLVSFDVGSTLAVGDTYIFFLRPVTNSEGQSGDLSMIMAWPVRDDATVTTLHLGDLSLAATTEWIRDGRRPS